MLTKLKPYQIKMIEDMKKAKTSLEKQVEHFEKQVNFLLSKKSGEFNLFGYMIVRVVHRSCR